MHNRKRFFIGIDLGWKNKQTTGICILEKGKEGTIFYSGFWCRLCQVVTGKDTLTKIGPYLKETAVIAIDAPLTKGQGKGKMRLYEKFLLTKIFRQEKITPIPPALMPELCNFASELTKKLERKGFLLDSNLIEVFPTIAKKFCGENIFLHLFGKKSESFPCETKDQKSALTCASLAYLHSIFKTRYLGYKDGFLFLPEMSFWKKEYRVKFYQAWKARNRLKYRHLITDVFTK